MNGIAMNIEQFGRLAATCKARKAKAYDRRHGDGAFAALGQAERERIQNDNLVRSMAIEACLIRYGMQ